MTPTANLEPANLAVWCELELARRGGGLLVARSKEGIFIGFLETTPLLSGEFKFAPHSQNGRPKIRCGCHFTSQSKRVTRLTPLHGGDLLTKLYLQNA